MGYLVAPSDVVRELRDLRRYVLRHPPGHMQRALALLIDSGNYHRALRHHRTQMKHKWERLVTAVQQVPAVFRRALPAGWRQLVGGRTGGPRLSRVDPRRAEPGVLIERGDIFYMQDDPPRNTIRIGYGAIPLRSIEPGIALLGQSCAEVLSSANR